jgi:HEAT repeat protein
MENQDEPQSDQRGEADEVKSPAIAALAVQFFLIPLIVVATVVGVYFGFRVLLNDKRTPSEYLNDIRVGGRERRWPAAYELSRLMSDPDIQLEYPELGSSLLRAFEGSDGDDPRVRRYLALAVGRLQSPPPETFVGLVNALDDADSETRISVIWALGSLGDASVVPELQRVYGSDDAGVRKMAVYALGAIDGDSQMVTLRTALNDVAPDVQWNAAIALARHGSDYGLSVLRRMLDREYVKQIVDPETGTGTNIDPVAEVMISGLQAVTMLEAESLQETVVELSQTDQSMQVRQAALEALDVLRRES